MKAKKPQVQLFSSIEEMKASSPEDVVRTPEQERFFEECSVYMARFRKTAPPHNENREREVQAKAS